MIKNKYREELKEFKEQSQKKQNSQRFMIVALYKKIRELDNTIEEMTKEINFMKLKSTFTKVHPE
jgi:hypothetical protein